MSRRRLRPAHNAAELAALYPRPHDHRRWVDHHLRVEATITLARWMISVVNGPIRSAADLSCGNAAIIDALAPDLSHVYRGDLAPGYPITGPLEQTVADLPEVDLFICSETLEHLDDPDVALKAIATKARVLIASTPVDAGEDPNPEHYWSWSHSDVDEMLTGTGWSTVAYVAADLRPLGPGFYCFGIFGCVRQLP